MTDKYERLPVYTNGCPDLIGRINDHNSEKYHMQGVDRIYRIEIVQIYLNSRNEEMCFIQIKRK